MPETRPFTALAAEKELVLLNRIHSMLETDPVESREEFADMMAVAFAHNRLNARALSDDMGYSFSTVYRWVEGRSAPHRSQWKQVQEWVCGALNEHIETISAQWTELAVEA